MISNSESSVALAAGMSAGVTATVLEIGSLGDYPDELLAATGPSSFFLRRASSQADDIIKVK